VTGSWCWLAGSSNGTVECEKLFDLFDLFFAHAIIMLFKRGKKSYSIDSILNGKKSVCKVD
jgi:hypothetical protein